MLAEPILYRCRQLCAQDPSVPCRGFKTSEVKALADHDKCKNQKPHAFSRYLLYGSAYADEAGGTNSYRMSGIKITFSEGLSVSAGSASEDSKEHQTFVTSSSDKVGKRNIPTKELVAMEPFDSISIEQMKDEDLWHFRHGPLPGDLAEIEAFCRIFRLSEQAHNAVMDALRIVNDAREVVDQITDSSNESAGFDERIPLAKEVPMLEEKVVSGLGCIGALVYQQKHAMLGGRLNVGFTPGARHDTMPPLAIFRAKLKKCCEELESSLLCYFPIDDSQFMAMHKKFQKLHNICLDAGHSRREDTPSHADIPNWGAVKSRTPWNNEKSVIENEVAFWRGGQPTDDGIQWLIHKGFKVIVDMRAEESSDLLAKSAMISAVSSRKLKHIKLPVEVSSNPTKDQVIEFSKLLADPNCHPLYLHSQKGVGRTSSMVSRWREIGLLRHSSEGSALSDSSSSLDSHSRADKMALDPSEGKDHIPKRRVDLADKHVLDLSRQADTTTTHEAMFSSTPFNAQRPVNNYLSKQEMKKFLRGRQMLPGTSHLKGSVKTPEVQVAATEEPHPLLSSTKEHEEIKVYDKQGILGDLKKHEDRNEQLSVQANGFTLADQKAEHMASHHNPSQKDPNQRTETRDSALYHSRYDGKEADDDDVPIIGDMCASTTGIVRLQSRKKAEMYLVRTDGFSCTREKVKESTLAFTHPSTQQQMLMWKTAPKTVLLLKKLGSELIQEAQQVASFLHYKEGMNVIVEPDVHDLFAKIPGFGFIQTFYVEDASNLHERVDFVVCLGGDGVILHASNIFRNAVPPVVSFNLGSLGFLTAHPFDHFMQDLSAIIHGNTMVEGVYITLRMRLRCEIYRHGKPVSGKFFDVLNEVVVDRGSSPYICKIECYERDRLITKVQADGVIVATPTGSTAYSTAAGGSMVHPNVPCMLFTPICPHSLSFRPVILPDSAVLELKVPEDARSNVWVSFDGKRRQQLSRGDSVRISMSQHPLPTVNKSDQTDDWFQSLVRCLNWNERLEQKAFS